MLALVQLIVVVAVPAAAVIGTVAVYKIKPWLGAAVIVVDHPLGAV
jgi:hypothetical protein